MKNSVVRQERKIINEDRIERKWGSERKNEDQEKKNRKLRSMRVEMRRGGWEINDEWHFFKQIFIFIAHEKIINFLWCDENFPSIR